MSAGDWKTGSNLTGGVLAQGQLTTSEVTQYTVPVASFVKLAKVVLCNTSGAAVTVSVSVVKAGGTAGAANRVLASWPLGAAGSTTSTVDLSECEGMQLGPGDFVSAVASAGGAVACTVSGAVSS